MDGCSITAEDSGKQKLLTGDKLKIIRDRMNTPKKLKQAYFFN